MAAKRPGRPDYHKGDDRPGSWRLLKHLKPHREDVVRAAEEVTPSVNAYINEAFLYLIGLRRDPPPRPEWAERRAASLPDPSAQVDETATEE